MAGVLAAAAAASLDAGGTLLCCHWRHGGEAWMLDPADVHAQFNRHRELRVQTRIADRDFLLDVWIRDGTHRAVQQERRE